MILKLYYKLFRLNKCCKDKEYKKINTSIKSNGKFKNIGYLPICYNCYSELIKD